ncbi:hypothetical protein [Acinetobacter entericus]|uniref:DNA-binding protein n=1 Tax=Acinetobacter entericus TaxID=2989714 RepID=A0ABT3NLU1_9GAMM|nr:hypothetical protein [Acinetobacter entericus]MCW8040523.1 hypothetical protein [Acinetobacter entericus]
MNSAAELKRHNENTALQKSKEKVIEALKHEPMGLSIAQLMTVCKLSIKTVKNILAVSDVDQEDGVYFLKSRSIAVLETKPQVRPVQKIKEEKSVVVNDDSSKESPKNKFCSKDLLLALERCDNGLTAKDIMDLFAINRSQLDQAIYHIRQSNEVKLIKDSLGVGRFTLIKETAVDPDVDPLLLQKKNNFHISEHQTSQPMNTSDEFTPTALEQLDPLESCKAQIKTVVTRKSELRLYEDQLRDLLANLFNLKNVKFCVDGGRLTGVYLSEEVVA